MNDELIQHALHNGPAGKQWLESIPSIIKEYEKKWSLKVFPPFYLSYNYVAPAVREDESQVVLKIGFPEDREFQTEINALEVFNGEGSEKLLAVDRERAVMLLEKVTPGTPLSSLTDDEQATRILVSVMKRLWKPLPENHTFIPISEWIRAIPQYLKKNKGAKGPLPTKLIEKANSLFEELIATSQEPALVHGDLHHDNILKSDRDEWLAIDPKGIAAEREYETAAMIRNPYEKLRHIPDVSGILRSRILILSEELGFDPKRIHKWCFAQTVLSFVWNDGGPKGSEYGIKIAEVLNRLRL